MRTSLLAALLAACAPALAQESVEQPYRPGFSTCAAYYFLSSRGHGVKEYDELYSAGEFSLNQATRLRGQEVANSEMEAASGVMMDEIDRDWRKIGIIDEKYGPSCEILLRDANYEYSRR